MKQSTSSKVTGYLFALLMFGLSISMFLQAFVWWGRNTLMVAGSACVGIVAFVTIWFHLWIGRKTSMIWAYTERLWWETHRIHEGANGEWTLCGTCQRRLPTLAFQVDEDGSSTCAYCSPEAKATGKGTYAVSKTQSSAKR